MKSASANGKPFRLLWISGALACGSLSTSGVLVAQQTSTKKVSAVSAREAKSFETPQQAADALVDAAEKFDMGTLVKIFGPEGGAIVLTGEYAQDRQRANGFAAKAREKKSVSVDPKTGSRALRGGRWSFDAKAGRQELEYRSIGSNELDAIEFCRGIVDAQYEYAFQKRDGYDVNQYAQHIISTSDKHDGLAWKNADGSWAGPVGERAARAIEEGYTSGAAYHGYFFKVLKGQGPDAPLGEMDFVVKGVMIGGFALVAAPAEYGETGLKTFIVSHDGVVYQKDLGPTTLEEFKNMERFNPDSSWTPVRDED
jgi:hypothetical protein